MGLTDIAQVYGPRFYLEAKGTLASDLIPYITELEYEDDEKKIDNFKIVVANPGLIWKDDPRFQEGASWRCVFGYLTNYSDVKNLIIRKAKPHYPSSGIPTIEMAGFSVQIAMNKLARGKNWGVVNSSDIAEAIASNWKFDTDIENSQDSRAQHRIQPAGMSDVQYLMALAHKLNWDFYIEGTTLHFHHTRLELPAELGFTYYTDGTGTLLKFDPDVNMNAQTKAGTAGTSPQTGKTEGAFGQNEPKEDRFYNVDLRGQKFGNFTLPPPGAQQGSQSLQASSPESDPRVIAKHGSAVASRIDMKAVKAQAEFIGDPRIRARTMIQINGVDHYYSGNWRVKSSRHSFKTSGYRVTAHLYRNAATAKSKKNNQSGPDADGGGGDKGAPVDNYVAVERSFSRFRT